MAQRESLQPLSASQLARLETATESYSKALTGGVPSPVVGHLQARGIDQATAATFRLGVVNDPEPGHERYRGMLAIPYLGKDGHAPWSLRFRCIESHDHAAHFHGKYNSLKGEATRIYNVAALHGAGNVIHVTEGELDAVTLAMCGLSAIGAPGANSWQWRHSKMLAGFSRLYIWGDPDEAGAEFVRKLQGIFRNSAVALKMPGGDVSDTYREGGKDAVLEILNQHHQQEEAA